MPSREDHLARRKLWRQENRAKVSAYNNRPDVMEKRKAWAKSNKEKVLDSARRSEAKHKEARSESRRIYNLSERGKKVRADFQDKYWSKPLNRLRKLYQSCVSRARKYGMPYDVELEANLVSNPSLKCAACDVDLEYRINVGRSHRSPSLDRKIPSKGYVVGNVFVICWGCNSLKSDATIEDLDNLLAYMKGN